MKKLKLIFRILKIDYLHAKIFNIYASIKACRLIVN